MTVDEVRKRVAEIGACTWDFEAAHAMEDRLRADVLKAIADGATGDAAALAAEALRSNEHDFVRYCA